MKKLLALLLAGILVFALVGCNNAEVSDETDNSGYSEELDESEEVVDKINMIYGDDETKITLYKPDGAFFSVDAEDAEDAGDIVIMLADDYSWDAEIMGYKHFEGISSNEPFVEYYFDGAASDDYTFYEQEMADLGIDFEGKPVKLIRYTYKEVDDEEEYKEFENGNYSMSKENLERIMRVLCLTEYKEIDINDYIDTNELSEEEIKDLSKIVCDIVGDVDA